MSSSDVSPRGLNDHLCDIADDVDAGIRLFDGNDTLSVPESVSRRLRVLVVEPEFALAAQFQLRLLTDGHDSNVVSTGKEALAAITPAYDLVITELRLSDISGEDLARKLRARLGLADLPVLVITSRGSPPQWTRKTPIGREPFAWDDLVGFVTEATRARHAAN